MADLLIDDLDATLVERLEAQAHRNGHSLEAEVKAILESAAHAFSIEQALSRLKARQQGIS